MSEPLGMAKKVTPRFKRPLLRNFVREWREYRGLTQEQLAERAGMSVGNVSQFERGLQGFSDEGLQALAEALGTQPGYLLMVNPNADEPIWSIWEKAKPAERKMIVDIAKTVVKTGT
jgi:transcriptional regulator with XRE-family HTH domain